MNFRKWTTQQPIMKGFKSVKKSHVTLQQRMAKFIGRNVVINAPGVRSKFGELTAVGKKYIKVQQTLMMPLKASEINIYDEPPFKKGIPVTIHVTYRERAFIARLLRIGKDFIEIIEGGDTDLQYLFIPLNKVISMERIVLEQ